MAEQRQFTKPSEVTLVDTITGYGGAGALNPELGATKKKVNLATIVTRTNTKNADGTPVYTKQVIRFDEKSSIPSDGNATYVDPNTGLTKNRYRSGTASLDPDVPGQDALSVYDYGDGTGEPVKIGEVIANGSTSDGALRLDPTRKATDLEKKNLLGPIFDSQKTQINSVKDDFPLNDLDQKALDEVGGTGRNFTSESPPDSPSTPVNPQDFLPRNPGNATGFEDFRYPEDLDISTQDSLLISIFDRQPRGFKGGVQQSTSAAAERNRGGRVDISKRLAAILLPIQGGINDRLSVNYDKNELNFLQGLAFEGIIKTVSEQKDGESGVNMLNDAFNQLRTGITAKQLKFAAGAAAASAALGNLKGNQSVNTVQSRFNGQVFNPNLELLFTGPNLREFTFQYLFTPRSQGEAGQVIGIIKTLKKYMLPRTQSSNQGEDSFFLKSPRIFRLEYQNDGSPHPFLNKFKDCALLSCGVEYTPQGTYATFPDGVMHAYRVTLNFTELDPVYAEDFEEGSGSTSFSTPGLNSTIRGFSSNFGSQSSGLGF